MNEYCLIQGQGLKALAALPSSAPSPPGLQPYPLQPTTCNLQKPANLKFKSQLTFAVFAAVNHLSGPL